MYSNVLQTARMASEMAQNPRTINWSYSTNTITYNEHDHIPHIQIHAHSTNTITSKKHDHIQQTQKHSTIHYKFSHLISTITFNTFEHTHTQQRRNQSHSAGPDHIQQSRSRHFLVVKQIPETCMPLFRMLTRKNCEHFCFLLTGSKCNTVVFEPGCVTVSVENTKGIFASTCLPELYMQLGSYSILRYQVYNSLIWLFTTKTPMMVVWCNCLLTSSSSD